jgi:hypothetical protein
MSGHRLEEGGRLIEAIRDLGRALGYAAVTEYPIDPSKASPQALDVVWMHDEDQSYPLMIFEVESRATNAAANNPLKIYSKRHFEKPLFFFHLFVEAGRHTSRLDDLREEYGKLNYRAYNLKVGELTAFLEDVLRQHRRLSWRLEVIPLVEALGQPPFDRSNVHGLLAHAEKLGFNRRLGTTLPSYAALCADDASFSEDFARYLTSRRSGSIPGEIDLYGTKFGDWCTPLHLGILSSLQADPSNPEFFERYRRWHENPPGPCLRIGPMFGLKMDFDFFLAHDSGPFMGLVALLMRGVPGATRYVAQELSKVLREIRPDVVAVWSHLASWCLHLYLTDPEAEDEFGDIRNLANRRGGIAERYLYQPYGGFPFAGMCEEVDRAFAANRVAVPDMAEFLARCFSHPLGLAEMRSRAVKLAARSLIDETVVEDWADEIIELLHSRAA